MRIVQVYGDFKVARVFRSVGVYWKRFHGSGDPCHFGCGYGPRWEMFGLERGLAPLVSADTDDFLER